MSLKRHSDEPINNETKTPRQEINEEEEESDKKERVNIKHYHPHLIFDVDKKNEIKEHNPKEMAGPSNFALAKSFCHSRYIWEIIQNLRHLTIYENFSRNAGAVQLYYKGGIKPFDIPGKKGKEYNIVSRPIPPVNDPSLYDASKNQTRTIYGHSERLLMRMVLDDLIEADHEQNGIPPRPSDYIEDRDNIKYYDYIVLRNMTNEAETYRKYLEKKGLIVKMWSERTACNYDDYEGAGCITFLKNICPEGSQYGYIAVDDETVKECYEQLHNAYCKRLESAVENSIIEAASNDPQVITQEIREEDGNQEAKEDSVEETVKFKYYHPTSILYNQLSDGNNDNQENMPQEMTGPSNSELATSFYHSRYTRENQEGTGNKREYKKCNAGAIQLYHKDGVTLYKIPGEKREEYNEVSKNMDGVYCHTERILMKMILDDLIRADCDEKGIPPRPSDCIPVERKPIGSSDVRELTVNSNKYKKYLEEKNLIVKIWSERPACVGNMSDEEGGDCKTFITSICPAGSQFGYIVGDLDPARDEGEQVKEAFSKFSKTFQEEFSTNKLP